MSSCIWYVSKYVAPPGRGSAGSRGFMLMQEFVKTGHRSVIITSNSNQLADVPDMKSSYQVQKIDGVYIHWVRTLKYEVAKSARRILSWLHFEWRLLLIPKSALPCPDVIVVSSLSLLTILNGLLWRRRYRCRLAFEIRDIWPLTIIEEGGYSKNNIFVRGLEWIEKLGYRSADAIVGTMPNLAEHVANQVGPGRPVHCIPMGIDPRSLTDIQPLPDGYVQAHIPQGKFVVAHVGSIGITNALDTFLNCAQRMSGESGIHFLVVGDGDLKAEYVRRYGYLPNVSFGPKVTKQMVQSVLSRCDLLYFSVHVSEVWRYGQSLNKVIDYMLAGKPVVASYTGFPSMINEAECGTYVPAGDEALLRLEICRYARMPVFEREAIGNRGREWILAERNYATLAANYLRILLPATNAKVAAS
jgi:glycosyltransferase involved in cell wall biosynthesis